jgi:hypothetical protein
MEDIKKQLDINQYLEEYTQKAYIVEDFQYYIDEFVCCICTRIAFKPVEYKECQKNMCSNCH